MPLGLDSVDELERFDRPVLAAICGNDNALCVSVRCVVGMPGGELWVDPGWRGDNLS